MLVTIHKESVVTAVKSLRRWLHLSIRHQLEVISQNLHRHKQFFFKLIKLTTNCLSLLTTSVNKWIIRRKI